ncbi:MAG TPA: Xaa-Pro peptidase family protein [Chloroflexia bacterium]|nr:Xaa-Pro peptidase family protein [Chloroflexia bacterium]
MDSLIPGVQAPPFEPQATPASELAWRAHRVQALMREAQIDGLIATHNPDVFYLSGVVQQAQVYLPVEGMPVLMVRKHHGRAVALTHLPESSVVSVSSLRELPAIISSTGRRPRTIGFELDVLPVTVFQAYERALSPLGARLVDASAVLRRARAVKSTYELSQIRRAAAVADAALNAAAEHLRPGIREIELAAAVEHAARVAGHSGAVRMRAYGQEMHMGHLLAGDSGSVASFMNSPTGGHGPGPWAPYGAGARTISRGEPIYIDYCGEWGGYIADQTRMLSIGPVDAFWRDSYDAMRSVAHHLEQTVRPGKTSGEVYEAAVAKATELGYGDNFMGPPDDISPGQRVPFVGHGVGLELDEWPPLQRNTDAMLEEGMVLAVEPKLIYEGKGAVGIEDTYLLTTDGLAPLTFSTRDILEV